MSTVLVVGGTGTLGTAVAHQLRADGYQVRLLVRREVRRSHLGGTEYIIGDLEDEDSLRRALDGCHALHLSVRGGPTAEQFDRVEHHGSGRLARLAAQAGVERLTFVSHSLAAPDAPAPDLRAKFHAEEAIATSGVPYTIFRPTYFMDTLPRHVQGRRAVVLGRQARPLHMVAATDFARLVSRSLTVPQSVGLHLDVHGPQAITIPDALRRYCNRLHPDTRVVSVPLQLMTILNRTVLHRRLDATLPLMKALQSQGERGNPRPTRQLLGATTTTLDEWLETRSLTQPGTH